jgi:hypothetical protein
MYLCFIHILATSVKVPDPGEPNICPRKKRKISRFEELDVLSTENEDSYELRGDLGRTIQQCSVKRY